MKTLSLSLVVSAAASALLLLPRQARAQDQPQPGFSASGELGLVVTSGNASSSSWSVRSTADYRWPRATLEVSAGGLRTESGTVTRTATGTPDDFTVTKTTVTKVTAENYFAKGRYDRTLSDGIYGFGGAGWERNTFAGFKGRTTLAAGAGRKWIDRDDAGFKTDLGVTYTNQNDVVKDPSVDNSYAGLQLSVNAHRTLTSTTKAASSIVVNDNLSNTSDFRYDWTTSLGVSITSALALKTSYELLFDNNPALVAVPLGDTQVLTPLDKVDTVFTVTVALSL